MHVLLLLQNILSPTITRALEAHPVQEWALRASPRLDSRLGPPCVTATICIAHLHGYREGRAARVHCWIYINYIGRCCCCCCFCTALSVPLFQNIHHLTHTLSLSLIRLRPKYRTNNNTAHDFLWASAAPFTHCSFILLWFSRRTCDDVHFHVLV